MDGPSATVRPPAVAGLFYPASPSVLRCTVERFLAEAKVSAEPELVPRGLIAPHAGYPYSGPVAASGYRLVGRLDGQVRRVLLLGPSHRVPFSGLAAPSWSAFSTPLGTVPVDVEAVQACLQLPAVRLYDRPHVQEHSLEVQLPFLQVCLSEFVLVPVVVGEATADEVAELVLRLWDEQTLVVVSSDLSHYLDYWTARTVDAETTKLIETLQWNRLTGERACGYRPVSGLLKACAERGLRVKTVDLRNSGDTAGDRSQVVGYGSYVVHE